MIVAVVFSAPFLFLFSCVGHEGFSGSSRREFDVVCLCVLKMFLKKIVLFFIFFFALN
jgi:hypothetical protein